MPSPHHLAGLALSLCATSFFPASPALAGDPAPAWLFTSFRGDGDGLHLAFSHDGLDWTDLDRVFLKPSVGSGLMRDPHLLRDPDGLYHLVWTSGWKDLGIGYATSHDLVHWSAQRFLPLAQELPGAQNCWAPELYRLPDTGEYLLVWSSAAPLPGGGPEPRFRAWYSLTRDFENFTGPKSLFDPGVDNIDATIVYSDGKYCLFYKETDDQPAGRWGAIRAAEAAHPRGPWTLLPEPVLAGERAEGPAPVVIGDRTLLYFDYYAEHRYGARETRDGRAWADVTPSASIVPGQRHGSILAAPADLVEQLRRESAAIAPPPALDALTADPSIRVFGDRYYIYPTSDRPYWNTTEFAVWSSPNLVDWRKENVILDLARGDVSWANIKAWAPDCIERDGTYYFYFCADGKIGVATARTPVGPFVDALGKPLLDRKADPRITTNTIDPWIFIDDDDQAYIYWANGPLNVFKLRPDMLGVEGDPVAFTIQGASSGEVIDIREAPVVFKRNGLYYFMWSVDDARSDDYRIAYGTSKSPFGPIDIPDHATVLKKNGPAKGTGHHSVVNVPGTDRWYVAYHRHAVPGGGGYKRETCLARMDFDAGGNILPIDPMKPAFLPGDVGEPLVNGLGRP